MSQEESIARHISMALIWPRAYRLNVRVALMGPIPNG
jgi:hypothetical protein